MIQVCPELEKKLDSIWCRLQTIVAADHNHRISQIDCDEQCVTLFEAMVILEEELREDAKK